MKIWNRTDSDDGISTAMVGPATVPELAEALDPSAPYVLLPDFTPIHGTWQNALIPLAPAQAMNPTPATVRRMTADVLLDTAAFMRLASELAEFGIEAMQFRQSLAQTCTTTNPGHRCAPRGTAPRVLRSTSSFPTLGRQP